MSTTRISKKQEYNPELKVINDYTIYNHTLGQGDEHQVVEDQKVWLDNWYKKRLPLLGKEELSEYVNKGLKTPYFYTTDSEKGDAVKKLKRDNDTKAIYHKSSTDITGPKSPDEYTIDDDGTVTIPRTVHYYPDYITFKSLDKYGKEGVPVHEFTHAATSIDSDGKSRYGYEITDKFTNNFNRESKHEYYGDPGERYARINQLRYVLNLNPLDRNYSIEKLVHLAGDNERAREIVMEL
jgi:hypothetical protein